MIIVNLRFLTRKNNKNKTFIYNLMNKGRMKINHKDKIIFTNQILKNYQILNKYLIVII
jgi:hypothetical protein